MVAAPTSVAEPPSAESRARDKSNDTYEKLHRCASYVPAIMVKTVTYANGKQVDLAVSYTCTSGTKAPRMYASTFYPKDDPKSRLYDKALPTCDGENHDITMKTTPGGKGADEFPKGSTIGYKVYIVSGAGRYKENVVKDEGEAEI